MQSAYVHHKEVKAALGVKITAPDLERAIAGSRLMVIGPDDDEEMEKLQYSRTKAVSVPNITFVTSYILHFLAR